VTELVLGQKLQSLGVQVERPHRVVGMKQNENDSRITDVSFEDGQVIRARYIIGADGARSIVRPQCSLISLVECLTAIYRFVPSLV